MCKSIILALYSLALAYFGVQLALRVTIFELDRSSSSAIHQVLANHGFDSFTLPVLDGQTLLLCSSDSGCETLSLIPTASSNSTPIPSVTLAPQTTLASSLPTVSVLSSSSPSPLAASPIASLVASATSDSVATIVFGTSIIPPTTSHTSTTSTSTAASVVVS